MSRDAISDLLDPGTSIARLRDAGIDAVSGRPVHVRYKPGRSAIIAYRLVTADGSTGRGYLRWAADAARVDEVTGKWASRRKDDICSVVRLGAHDVFFPFPHDAELVRLRWYTSPRKLKRSIGDALGTALGIGRLSGSQSDVDVLVHKPERRVVVRADLTGDDGRRTVVIRCATDPSGIRRAAIAEAARLGGLNTPASIGVVDEGRVTVDGYLLGTPLAELSPESIGCLDPAALADSIVRFQALDVVPGVPRLVPVDHLESARQALWWLAEWSPPLRASVHAVARRLADTCPEPGNPVLAHGDLHDGNVVFDGSEVGLIDLDRVAVADAEVDLGRLRAAAIDSPSDPGGRTRFADVVIASVGLQHRLDDGRLNWFTAVGLVDRAVLTARHLEPDADARGERLLDAVLHLLADPCAGTVAR